MFNRKQEVLEKWTIKINGEEYPIRCDRDLVEKAASLGYTTLRPVFVMSGEKVLYTNTQVRLGFNPETFSDIWIDLDNPNAIWNKASCT